MLRELVELFRVECPKQMAEIRRQQAAGDLPGLARAAHTLKGSVSMFAAQKPPTTRPFASRQWAAPATPRNSTTLGPILQPEIDRLISASTASSQESGTS